MVHVHQTNLYNKQFSFSRGLESQFPIAMSGMSKAQLVDAMDKALEAMMTLMEVANKNAGRFRICYIWVLKKIGTKQKQRAKLVMCIPSINFWGFNDFEPRRFGDDLEDKLFGVILIDFPLGGFRWYGLIKGFLNIPQYGSEVIHVDHGNASQCLFRFS